MRHAILAPDFSFSPSGTDTSDLRRFAPLLRYLSATCYFRTSATTSMVQLHAAFTATLHLQQHSPCGCQSALFRSTALTHVTSGYCATASGQATSPSVPQTLACHLLATRLLRLSTLQRSAILWSLCQISNSLLVLHSETIRLFLATATYLRPARIHRTYTYSRRRYFLKRQLLSYFSERLPPGILLRRQRYSQGQSQLPTCCTGSVSD